MARLTAKGFYLLGGGGVHGSNFKYNNMKLTLALLGILLFASCSKDKDEPLVNRDYTGAIVTDLWNGSIGGTLTRYSITALIDGQKYTIGGLISTSLEAKATFKFDNIDAALNGAVPINRSDVEGVIEFKNLNLTFTFVINDGGIATVKGTGVNSLVFNAETEAAAINLTANPDQARAAVKAMLLDGNSWNYFGFAKKE